MRTRSSMKQNFTRLLMAPLVVLLIGCGSISNAPTITHKSQNRLIPSPTVGTSTQNTSFPPPILYGYPFVHGDFDVQGLLHISPTVACGSGPEGVPFDVPETLILSSDRLTYSDSEIQQMKAWLASRSFDTTLSQPPSTLQWVSGTLTGTQCEVVLAVTNIATTTIQISQINMRLTRDAQQNHAHYPLINTCSLWITPHDVQSPTLGCVPGGGGPFVYYFNYALSPSKANTVFPGHVDALPGYSPLPTLNPGDVVALDLFFSSQSIADGFIYTIIPEMVLNLGNTEDRVSLQQLSTTIAFANADQFTCYSLQGNTFVPVAFKTGGADWDAINCV